MIDKNFYLENLSAFDILIEDEDRQQAESLIFRVYSMLQRDKIWMNDVAGKDEIFEDDIEFIEQIDQELKELDEQYDFRFDDFYKLVQQKLKEKQSYLDVNSESSDIIIQNNDILVETEENFLEELDDELETEDEDDYFDEEEESEFSDISDEELDLVTDFILESAKTRFNYSDFLESLLPMDKDFVNNDIILAIIAEKAFGVETTEIAENILFACEEAVYEMDEEDLEKIIDKKSKELGAELLAFKIASDSLQQGANPVNVVQQISQLLRSK
ncbi:hypothetical protein [Halpernia frigidisoli]|uniref:Uncharacterized protein n=1 Tax=Halpernia frigidisoli TaxID=1125876 RepID=A0A1I3CYB4_9FLAO|nr:hypothetical protein [Halpernia frigidisoli]SFH79504.1 hypothetical protein SAMN05443292_0153 [Halpernia frigidisoli]